MSDQLLVATNPASIINDEDQARLMALDEILTLSYFTIGGIANKYIELAPTIRNGRVITHEAIYRAVGYFCGGRKARTIRGYAEIARRFPPEVQAEFELPFAQYLEARKQGEKWREYLEVAYENPSVGVKGVRQIYEEKQNGGGKEAGVSLEITPPPQNGDTNYYAETILIFGIISRLIYLLERIPSEQLSEPLRNALNSHIQGVLGCLPALRLELEGTL